MSNIGEEGLVSGRVGVPNHIQRSVQAFETDDLLLLLVGQPSSIRLVLARLKSSQKQLRGPLRPGSFLLPGLLNERMESIGHITNRQDL